MHRAAQRAWPSPTASCRKSWGYATPSWWAPSWAGRMPPWGSGAVRFLVEALNAAPWRPGTATTTTTRRAAPGLPRRPPAGPDPIWPQAEFWVARDVLVRRPGQEPKGSSQARRAGQGLEGEQTGVPAGGGGRESSRLAGRGAWCCSWPTSPACAGAPTAGSWLQFAGRCGVGQAMFFGRPTPTSPTPAPPSSPAGPPSPACASRLESLGVPFSPYQGPSSMQSAATRGLPGGGHRLRQSLQQRAVLPDHPQRQPLPRPPARLTATFRLEVNLHPWRRAAATLSRQVSGAIEERSNAEFREHLRRLEIPLSTTRRPPCPR